MTDKEFRRLKRAELVEIIYELQNNEARLQKEVDALRKRLADRELKILEAGSIAEAAISVNGVLEAAQAAADQYLEQIRRMRSEAEREAYQILEDAKKQARLR